ncbi:MAG: histidine phosphatase family protein [Microthrixaceae bacterium]|nr:histidine phosphatase family protein [Microthrixaceae bacterium]
MIFVVRHGRTASNAAGLLLGRADPPLDEEGSRQADALGHALGKVDLVVSSPLARARQTAATIDGPIQVDERFIELDYGEWDQLPIGTLPSGSWERWQADLDFAPPGGESLASLGARVRDGLDELVEEGRASKVVVVTHVSPLKAAAAWALGVGDEIAWRMYVAPASVTCIDVSRSRPTLVSFNDTQHLA